MLYQLPTTNDEVYRLLAASTVGIAKIRDRGDIVADAHLTGSGTLVRVGGVAGILTAAHVLARLRERTIGIIPFTRVESTSQFKLDIEESDLVFAEGWPNGPDLAFLRIANQERVGTLEAWGCVFYNLELNRPIPSNADEFCLCGVIDETRIVEETAGRPPITGYQAMFGAVSSVDVNDGSETLRVRLAHDADIPPPQSYGGVSGGALWLISRNGTDTPFRILVGVAYYECDADSWNMREILCCSIWQAYASLLPKVTAEFTE